MFVTGHLTKREVRTDKEGDYLACRIQLKGGRTIGVDVGTDHGVLGAAEPGALVACTLVEREGETYLYPLDNGEAVLAAMRPPAPTSAPPRTSDAMSAEELHGIVEHVVGENLVDLVERIRIATVKAGTLKADTEHLERKRKALRARLAEQFRTGKLSEARLAQMAEASDEYQAHLDLQHEKTLELVEAEAEMYRLRNLHETLLRELAFARTELERTARSA